MDLLNLPTTNKLWKL